MMRPILLPSMLILMVLASLIFSLFSGNVSIHDSDFISIFTQLRLPRTLSSFVCGGLLALAGALMQLLLGNPLADPYVLGVSGGAACMTLLFMFFGFSENYLLIGAWVGSFATMILVFTLTKKHRWQTHALLLCGIALACGYSAVISLILLLSPDTNLHNMLFWLSGDLNISKIPWVPSLILGFSILICVSISQTLNIFSRGTQSAQALGVDCERYRMLLYCLSSLLTASAVTIAGSIGFVGLIIPHLTRLLIGFDHRTVLPLSILLGGSLLTFADTLSRTLFAPQQIPVGILLAMIGVPLFIWLIKSSHA